jgi:hypothetical protein
MFKEQTVIMYNSVIVSYKTKLIGMNSDSILNVRNFCLGL